MTIGSTVGEAWRMKVHWRRAVEGDERDYRTRRRERKKMSLKSNQTRRMEIVAE